MLETIQCAIGAGIPVHSVSSRPVVVLLPPEEDADGVIDLYFGPNAPVFDGTWKLNDIEEVK